jgi:hypothetical protein
MVLVFCHADGQACKLSRGEQMADAEAARAAAEARRQKILARGRDRLAQITVGGTPGETTMRTLVLNHSQYSTAPLARQVSNPNPLHST